MHGAAPDHPMELYRAKYLAERELEASGLSWTIVRPTAYMETLAPVIGEPLLKKGRTRIFGKGENPSTSFRPATWRASSSSPS